MSNAAPLLWWLCLGIQALAIPGALLPVLPGLALLPLGALLWIWAVGCSVGWPSLLLAIVLLVLGWGAEALGLVLGPAKLQASRWAGLGAGLGLLVGLLGLLRPCPLAAPCWACCWAPFWGRAWPSGWRPAVAWAGLCRWGWRCWWGCW